MKYKPVPTYEDYEIAEKNGISKTNVDARVNRLGWSIEKAITTPIRVTFRKRYEKYVKLAEKNRISYANFKNRVVFQGWDPEDAATKPIITGKQKIENLIESIEKRRKIPEEIYEKSRKNGLKDNVVRARILYLNWDVETAITKKIDKKYSQRRKGKKYIKSN